MATISTIEGIGPKYAADLNAAGIRSCEALLKRAGSKKGRKELSGESGISEGLLLEWVNRADLMRVKGVGEEYSDLLERAGVDTCAELAQRNAENLFAKLAEVAASGNIVRRPPSQGEVTRWVAHAKTLDKAVTH